MRLVINGALGRMGRRIIALAREDDEIDIVGAVDLNGEMKGRDIGLLAGVGALGITLDNNLGTVIENADVVIDFTVADSMLETAEQCSNASVPLVSGTTGLSTGDREKFIRIVEGIPCVYAPNMSVGVNLLFKLVAETASILGDDYDVEITEVHHRFKKDSPSGTARRIAEIVAEKRGISLDKEAVHGRYGMTGERTRTEIGIHAVRAGDVVGEHTVTFGTIGERLELAHKAQSRDAFASGAIRAAKFACSARPGIYDMQDVLGLR
ncbi:MAG: 4-hydroxy-tetrahydrodipicolinate reductase [Candidatus Latescibacteria bacterium]|nr:4-hydroxy-tetrahydrodipicolinate reductase [Candidatus Latescibacterota bacterium]